jgi:hypothetical protein
MNKSDIRLFLLPLSYISNEVTKSKNYSYLLPECSTLRRHNEPLSVEINDLLLAEGLQAHQQPTI